MFPLLYSDEYSIIFDFNVWKLSLWEFLSANNLKLGYYLGIF